MVGTDDGVGQLAFRLLDGEFPKTQHPPLVVLAIGALAPACVGPLPCLFNSGDTWSFPGGGRVGRICVGIVSI